MADKLTARQLRVIADVRNAADDLDMEVWLRGGWAMDFYLGEVTRAHVDIDWFCWRHDADSLAAALLARGYQPDSSTDAQRDFVHDGVELSFALLEKDPGGRVVVGGGPYRGAPWPAGMLDAPAGRLGGLVCPIISAQAQIEVKRMYPVWMPQRPRRGKDATDVALLCAAIAARSTPPDCAMPPDKSASPDSATPLESATPPDCATPPDKSALPDKSMPSAGAVRRAQRGSRRTPAPGEQA